MCASSTLAPKLLEGPGCALDGRVDVRVGDREVELDAVADAKPPHAVVEAADQVGDGAAQRDRVPRVVAGERLEHDGRVADVPGYRA